MQQKACGMDYVSDGEMSKLSFMEYPYSRLTGFDGPVSTWLPPDIADFPETQDFWYTASSPYVTLRQNNGPVVVHDQEAVYKDIFLLKEALLSVQVEEAFVCAASPGAIANPGTSYYPSEAAFLSDIVKAMQPEYRAIVDAGYILQLDIPDILMMGAYFLHDRDHYRRAVQPRLDAIKQALTGLPAERVILHACNGNWPGPHHLDVPLDWILDLLLDIPAQGISIEATTHPHQHEWHIFENSRIAERFSSGEKLLFLGLIDTKARALESTEEIADRLERTARLIGKENVVASTDCGFGTFLGRTIITPRLVEEKMKRLSEGAKIASQRLWSPRGRPATIQSGESALKTGT